MEVFQRNDFSLKLTYKDKETQLPVNLEGYTLTFVCIPLLKEQLITIPTKNVLLTGTDAQNGIISFNLTSIDTDVPSGTYICQFELSTLGSRQTFKQENLTVKHNLNVN